MNWLENIGTFGKTAWGDQQKVEEKESLRNTILINKRLKGTNSLGDPQQVR